jgi:hypothetical protein
VQKERSEEVALELFEPLIGSGRVIDASTQDGVSGATLELRATAAAGYGPSWGEPIQSGANGTFENLAFSHGENALLVSADGYAEREVRASARDGRLDWGDIALHKKQALHISLEGLDALQDVSVSALRTSEADGLLPDQVFDTSGRVTYPAVAPGDYRLLVYQDESTWSRLQLKLEPGDDWSYIHRFAGSKRLDLFVVDENEAPSSEALGVLVMAYEDSAFTMRYRSRSADGGFHFEGIVSDQVQVQVFDAEGSILLSRSVSFEGAETLEVVWPLGQESMTVKVVDQEGNALPSVKLTVRSIDGSGIVCATTTDAGGTAILRGIMAEPLLLDARHEQFGARYGMPFNGGQLEHEVTLSPEGALELVIQDGDEPLADVSARVETPDGTWLNLSRTSTSGGRARFDGLGEGSYHIVCRRADCWTVVVDRALAANEVASVPVQMRRLSDFELTVVDANGVLVSGVELTLTSNEFGVSVADWLTQGRVLCERGLTTDVAGKVSVQRVPRGTYEWSVSSPLGDFRGSFELAPGSENRPRVVLLP